MSDEAMTCKDAIAVLVDYLEALLTPRDVARLEEHLDDCAACRAYLATYKATQRLAAETSRVEMPDEMKARLQSFLVAKLRAVNPDQRRSRS